jgi:thiol-disulfide isomerase/thioredoxin
MKRKIVLAGLMVIAGVMLAAAQSTAPKDPQLIDIQGYQKILDQYKGKPLLVTFWATWCEPCRDEYPMLNELAKQYAPQGLKVVGIDLDQDGDLILMRRFLTRYKPIFPNYRKKKGEENTFSQGVMPGWNGAIPASFFYAKDGTQIGHLVGASSQETYDAAIRMLLSK